MLSKSRIALLFVVMIGTSSCDVAPTEQSSDLIRLWNLAHRPVPTVFGYTSAQVIFRDDATFTFVGVHPLSQSILQDFIVHGISSRTADAITLDTGDQAKTWHVTFMRSQGRFEDPANAETFTLFRPGPDRSGDVLAYHSSAGRSPCSHGVSC